MHSIKLKLENPPEMEKYFREFGKLKRIAYNRLSQGKRPTEVIQWIKQNVKTFFDSSLIEFASADAGTTLKAQEGLQIAKITFGSKKSFKDYNKGKISKEELIQKRNPSLMTIGRAADRQGNRKFKIDIKNQRFFFCPDKNTSFELKVLAKAKMFLKLAEYEERAKARELPITYRLTRTHLIISIDETRLAKPTEKIKDRILGIDLNPNYIGISVSDFDRNGQREVFSQVFDLTKLNKLSTNKKKYEQLQISNRIAKLASHYKVETVAVEKLEIRTENHNKGKKFNKLLNTWDRNTFTNNVRKHCGFLGIHFQEVIPEYSSFVGCLQHPTKIDSVAASLELARRANLFINIYVNKLLPKETKIVFPEFNNHLLNRWKEEAGILELSNWKSAFDWFKKNPKLCYRILFRDSHREIFRFKSRKTRVFLCLG